MNKKNSELTYKEIYLQPSSFQAINDSLVEIYSVLDIVFSKENKYDEIIFTGCGTSFYLAQASAHAFSTYNHIPAKAVPCSELYYYPEIFIANRNVLICPITRKSYTTEVRMAIDKVRIYDNVKTLAITCDKDSSLYNDYILLSKDAAEESVIMTRSFTSMLYLAVIMAMYTGGEKEQIEALQNYSKISEEILGAMDILSKKLVQNHSNANLFITLGQGIYYGVANECMNKMKEMGLTNSEAYYSLEYRHGPMSLVDERTMIIFLCGKDTLESDAKLLTQMKSFGAITIAIGENVKEAMPDANYHYELTNNLNDCQYAPVIGFIGQLVGYYLAEEKQLDADSPRHLTQAIVLK